jgi:hypothetical protein
MSPEPTPQTQQLDALRAETKSGVECLISLTKNLSPYERERWLAALEAGALKEQDLGIVRSIREYRKLLRSLR